MSIKIKNHSILLFVAAGLIGSSSTCIIIFSNLPSLLKSFYDRDLSGNQLQQLPPRLFDYNTKLTSL